MACKGQKERQYVNRMITARSEQGRLQPPKPHGQHKKKKKI